MHVTYHALKLDIANRRVLQGILTIISIEMNEKSDSDQNCCVSTSQWGRVISVLPEPPVAKGNRKIMPKSTNTVSDESNIIKTETKNNSGMDTLDFNHLPQVQRLVKLERDSSFGTLMNYY